MLLRICADYANSHTNRLQTATEIYVASSFQWVTLRATIAYPYAN